MRLSKKGNPITREVLLFFVALAIFIITISEPARNFLIRLYDLYQITPFQTFAIKGFLILLVFWYPLYIIVRFIIWIVKKLKKQP